MRQLSTSTALSLRTCYSWHRGCHAEVLESATAGLLGDGSANEVCEDKSLAVAEMAGQCCSS